jgi:hypothetical protein
MLLTIVISGMAVGYAVELLTSLLDRWLSSFLIKVTTTLPFSFLFNWLLGTIGYPLVVSALASGFFALTIMSFVNRPVVVNSSLRR